MCTGEYGIGIRDSVDNNDQAHLFAVETGEDDKVFLRSVKFGRYIGFDERAKLILVDDNKKKPWQINIKV